MYLLMTFTLSLFLYATFYPAPALGVVGVALTVLIGAAIIKALPNS